MFGSNTQPKRRVRDTELPWVCQDCKKHNPYYVKICLRCGEDKYAIRK